MEDKGQTGYRWLIITALALQAVGVAMVAAGAYKEGTRAIGVEVVHDTIYVERPSQWDDFVDTLITIESNGKADAVNETTGAVGWLQLMPCYVQEVNRILGSENYSLDDRYDPVKTMEMFLIYQRHYNPERDIDKAIRLHNPKAGEWYKERIKSKMRKI